MSEFEANQPTLRNRISPSLDSLSFELFELIANNLKLKDRLKLRLVSKLWLRKVDNLRVKKVYISDKSKNLIPNRFRKNRNEFAFNFICIHPLKFDLFFKKYQNTISNSLKCLGVYNIESNDEFKKGFNATINSLAHLEKLILSRLSLDELFRLSLPKLAIVVFQEIRVKRIVLDTVKLRSVEVDFKDHFDFDFIYPESIEYILFNNYNGCLDKFKFESLKYLNCGRYLEHLYVFGPSFLTNLPVLNELHLCVRIDTFTRIYEQKLALKRHQLKIYNYGVLVDNPSQFNQLFDNNVVYLPSLHTKMLKFYGGDLSRLADKIQFFNEFNYTAVLESSEIVLPYEVLDRYDSIDYIFINETIKNDKQFTNYMTSIKNLSNLSSFLIYTKMPSNNILNQIPNLFPYLKELVFRRISTNNQNLDWIFKLKYLIELETSFTFKSEFISMLFRKLKYLNLLIFVGLFNSTAKNYHDLRICKSNRFKLHVSSTGDNFEFDNLSTIIQLLVTRNLI